MGLTTSVRAVIFDMDGLLIDSEPIWREAEQEIFGNIGIELNDSMCRETMGLRVDEVIDYWFERRRHTPIEKDDLKNLIVEKVCGLIHAKGVLLPVVLEMLQYLAALQMPMAIATSSTMPVVHAVIEKTGIAHYFQAVHSAEREILGKPHPAVFITAAQKLGVSPEHVLVFEDSFHGVVAALAAKMQVFAIPDKEQMHQARFAAATALFENMESALEFLKTQGLKGIS